MPAWLCVASSSTWGIVKKRRIWGAPGGTLNLRLVSQVEPGDFLAFYLVNPVRRIVGLYRAASPMFTETTIEPWSDRHYPHRIRIRPLSREAAELDRPIRFDEIVGRIGKIQNRWSLYGRSIVQLTESEFAFLCSLAKVSVPEDQFG
jgi:predicted RNA-binding protein